MTEEDKKQLHFEIDCIFESGANEIRIFEMVKLFIEQRSLINTLPIHDVSKPLEFDKCPICRSKRVKRTNIVIRGRYVYECLACCEQFSN